MGIEWLLEILKFANYRIRLTNYLGISEISMPIKKMNNNNLINSINKNLILPDKSLIPTVFL